MDRIVDIHREKMRVKEKFTKTPIALVNDNYLGLAWMRGEYKLHRHDQDELFLVMEGHLTIEVDGVVHELDPGQAITILKGSAHRSRSEMMTLVAVFEPQKINIEYL